MCLPRRMLGLFGSRFALAAAAALVGLSAPLSAQQPVSRRLANGLEVVALPTASTSVVVIEPVRSSWCRADADPLLIEASNSVATVSVVGVTPSRV
jgi:hypothetical protein